MATVTPDFRETLRRAGITEDKPLHAVLTTVMETAEQAREAVGNGARGLTEQGEAELIRRVTHAAKASTEQEAARIVRRSSFTTAALLLVAGLWVTAIAYGIGRWDGERHVATVQDTGTFLSQLASLNDLQAMAEACRKTQRQDQGDIACDLPPVWVKR